MDLQVRYGGEKGDLSIFPDRDNAEGINTPTDFIKFRIRDIVNGKYIIFPALLSNITDNSSEQPIVHLVTLVVQIKFTYMVDMKEPFHLPFK